MTAIYGHRWVSSFGDNPTGIGGDTWAVGLSGLSGQQLAEGLRSCVASSDPWPPTLPEFRAMCFGIPSLVAVRAEIHGKADRTPFAILVWQRLDSYQFKQVSAKDAERLLRDAYDDAREFVMRGGELPEIVPAITKEERKPEYVSPEVAAKHMLDLRKELYGDVSASDRQ